MNDPSFDAYPQLPDSLVGYTAGILDGEGSIQSDPESSVVAKITIVQAEKNNGEYLLTYLASEWQMGKLYFRVRQTNLGVEGRMWIWQISARRDILFLLETTLPYLVVKREKALLAIEHIRQHIDDQQRWTVYTQAEDNYIKAYYLQLPVSEIASHLHRTPTAISLRAKVLGIQREGGKAWRSYNPVENGWTAEEDNFLREHYGKVLSEDSAKRLDRTIGATRARAERLGLARKRGERRKLDRLP